MMLELYSRITMAAADNRSANACIETKHQYGAAEQMEKRWG